MTTSIVEVPNHYGDYAYTEFVEQINRDIQTQARQRSVYGQYPDSIIERIMVLNTIQTIVDDLHFFTSQMWEKVAIDGSFWMAAKVYNPQNEAYDLQQYQVVKHLQQRHSQSYLPVYEVRQRFRWYEFRIMAVIGLDDDEWVFNPPKMIFTEVFTKERLTHQPAHPDLLTRQYLKFTILTYKQILHDSAWLTKMERAVLS